MKAPFVYIVRKRAMGDALWIEPVIRQLADRYKKVIVYTKFPELFENYPLPNVTFTKNLGIFVKLLWKLESFLGTRFFVINLDNAYEKNPKMHFLNAYQLKAGVPETREYPRIYLSNEEQRRDPPVAGKYAVIHLESFAVRNYRKVHGVNWEKITAYLIERGFTVIQVGKHPPEIKGARHISTSIREMIVLLSRSSLFIGIDSGPSHIAASLNVPSLIFFGAINPGYRHFPELLNGIVLQQYCEHAGCYHDVKDNIYGNPCRLVGDDGIPKCSIHTDAETIFNINQLISRHVTSESSIETHK